MGVGLQSVTHFLRLIKGVHNCNPFPKSSRVFDFFKKQGKGPPFGIHKFSPLSLELHPHLQGLEPMIDNALLYTNNF